MIFNRNRLCAIITLLAITCMPSLFARLTTLQHFDPAPNFSANDSMMPANSQFLDLKQARLKEEIPSKRKVFGFNISGFIQGASRSKGYTGNTVFGTVVGTPLYGFEMGDFRGTMYVMGLFLGKNPKNGNSIWKDNVDTGDVTDITPCSIEEFGLPSCLENIAKWLNGNVAGSPLAPVDCTATTQDLTKALVLYPRTTALNPTVADSNIPSVFSESALANDTKYFGAFSMPLEYRKQGLRLELNVNCGDFVGITVQSGIVNMKQKFINTIASQTGILPSGATACAINGQTAVGPYNLSDVQASCSSSGSSPTPGTPSTISPLYANLNFAKNPATPPLNTPAQQLFDTYISNNLANILDPVCGHNQSLCTFDDYSLEDVRIIMTLQHAYEPNRYNRHTEEGDDWSDMVFTPYIWAGGTFPIATEIDYKNLLSLPFGNNGHPSVGSGIGMTFDFAETVEVGVEGGMTYFLSKEESRPFPTHPLQRILYPFSANVTTQPGVNWHAKALLNAYQFIKHVNFWFTYEFIEHRKDSFTICDKEKAEFFYPDTLECVSDWRAQFFNAGVSFDIQPGMQASFVWQQPISPRNAYYPVSIMGSINFMF